MLDPTTRRTFLTRSAALGAAVLAGCATDTTTTPPASARPTTPTTTPTTTTPISNAQSTTAPTTVLPPTTTAPTTTTSTTVAASSEPWWLTGNFAPVDGPLDATDLRVTGTIPTGLSGTWVRNGPNPHTGTSRHWFLAVGMLHGVRLSDGRAEWYRRRLVETPYQLDAETEPIPGGPVSYSSVSTVDHGGRLLSLGEIGLPYEINVDDLSTIGPYDYNGALTTNMTAHPKIDPASGDLHFFGYNFVEPYLTYLVADAAGTVRTSSAISMPQPSMIHDFAITEQYALFLDLSVLFDPADPALPYRFDRAHQCRLGVIDIAATADTTRWFDIEPGFVFHTINAHQSGSTITYDVIRYDELWVNDSTEPLPSGYPYRYLVDLDAGTVSEGRIDDRPVEFPMIDRRLTGRPHTTSWATSVGSSLSTPTDTSLVQYGIDGSSVSKSFDLPSGDIGAEPLFVADPERTDEGGGWLMMVVYRTKTDRSNLIIVDAADVAAGAIATIELPERVPFGFHGSWSPA